MTRGVLGKECLDVVRPRKVEKWRAFVERSHGWFEESLMGVSSLEEPGDSGCCSILVIEERKGGIEEDGLKYLVREGGPGWDSVVRHERNDFLDYTMSEFYVTVSNCALHVLDTSA